MFRERERKNPPTSYPYPGNVMCVHRKINQISTPPFLIINMLWEKKKKKNALIILLFMWLAIEWIIWATREVNNR